ncbi:ileal sodium/bile acid cotransporter-like [Anneissia japonica]|uniref:ileal sodium/bile acid cotransporter-like n=1 Tax=Anneissia japonica TaxID=1529436 RepID=UPI00142599AB|nr:ileal sodium/bile acid cotransporter-like [Anneissia japonica]
MKTEAQASPVKSLLDVFSTTQAKQSTDVQNIMAITDDDLPSNLKVMEITTEVVIFMTIVAINLAMGCTLTTNDFKRQWKFPSGIILGMISKILMYPFTAFALNHLLEIPSPYAIGVILMVVCPGSSVSSLFTYFVDGDVCMSVFSTAFSTLLSIGLLPALLYIYTRSWTTYTAVVPYLSIAAMLLVIISPVLLGMVLRVWKPKVANVIVTIGTTIGIVGYSACALFHIFLQTSVRHSTWNVYFIALVLPIVGFGVGYCTGYVFKQHPSRCRTIAIGTVFQNSGIAILTLVATVENFEWSQCVVFPIVYGAVSGLYGLVYTLVFRGLQHPSKAPTEWIVMAGGYTSLEPGDDFENPWLLEADKDDMSFRY